MKIRRILYHQSFYRGGIKGMNKLQTFFSWMLVVLAPLFLSQPVLAYQEIEVKNGGTLQGHTYLKGKIPQPRVYHLVLFPNIDM